MFFLVFFFLFYLFFHFSYVKILIDKNDAPLIAYYTSTLGKQEQIDMFTIYCEKILDNKERQEVLQFAEDAGLDVRAITKNVTEKIINKPDEDISHLSTLQVSNQTKPNG